MFESMMLHALCIYLYVHLYYECLPYVLMCVSSYKDAVMMLMLKATRFGV